MQKIIAKIIDPLGLHARPISLIVATANKFKSDIYINVNKKDANLKSIVKVLSLGIKFNDIAIFSISGSDEIEAFKLLIDKMQKNQIIELIL